MNVMRAADRASDAETARLDLVEAVEGLDTGWREGQGNRHAYCISPVRLRAVLADVTPAVQGDTGDAPPAEQEAGEAYYSCGHAYREPGCGWPCCGYPDLAAPSGSDDTKGGE